VIRRLFCDQRYPSARCNPEQCAQKPAALQKLGLFRRLRPSHTKGAFENELKLCVFVEGEFLPDAGSHHVSCGGTDRSANGRILVSRAAIPVAAPASAPAAAACSAVFRVLEVASISPSWSYAT